MLKKVYGIARKPIQIRLEKEKLKGTFTGPFLINHL
jgi:hypothetical protein